MRLIYMNHLLKDQANRRRRIPEPVIAYQSDNSLTYANRVAILDAQGNELAVVTWHRKGNKHCPHHKVLAWVELADSAGVRVE